MLPVDFFGHVGACNGQVVLHISDFFFFYLLMCCILHAIILTYHYLLIYVFHC